MRVYDNIKDVNININEKCLLNKQYALKNSIFINKG